MVDTAVKSPDNMIREEIRSQIRRDGRIGKPATIAVTVANGVKTVLNNLQVARIQ